jgi:hypothetical protein
MKRQIATYPFISKARRKYRAICKDNPGLSPSLPGGNIVPSGGHIYVKLLLENGGTIVYRFTPRTSWKIHSASLVEVIDAAKASGVPLTPAERLIDKFFDTFRMVNASGKASQEAKRLLGELRDTIVASRPWQSEHAVQGNGAYPPPNGGKPDHHHHAQAF